jgi:pimeloyl-ACP methyl ester carboxylesterase
MPTVTSADGTTIAFTRAGSGPAIVLVDGAMCYRGMGPMSGLAERLTDHFTVYTYDRRGRGESGDTLPFAVEREIEDLDALVTHAGGSAYGYAISSGAALALRAAAAGVPWRGLRAAVHGTEAGLQPRPGRTAQGRAPG